MIFYCFVIKNVYEVPSTLTNILLQKNVLSEAPGHTKFIYFFTITRLNMLVRPYTRKLKNPGPGPVVQFHNSIERVIV